MYIILITGQGDHVTEWVLGPYVTHESAELDATRFLNLVDPERKDLEYEVTAPEPFTQAYREQQAAQKEMERNS
jgi:hypothetical protein